MMGHSKTGPTNGLNKRDGAAGLLVLVHTWRHTGRVPSPRTCDALINAVIVRRRGSFAVLVDRRSQMNNPDKREKAAGLLVLVYPCGDACGRPAGP